MYKNQLQELAQRSCFSLPSYTCIREGPDHAPRFKAAVNFNGDMFESPSFCTTLRQAEHAAAEAALHSLATRGPSHSLAARILDETGVYKNLLQEVAQRVGAPLPSYRTFRSGLGHFPVFTGTVELAGIIFTGEPAKSKKQAEKNAAMAAWLSLKKLAREASNSSNEPENNDEQEQITIARALLNYRIKEKIAAADNPHATPFPKFFPVQPEKRPSTIQPSTPAGSKILPFIQQKSGPRTRPTSPAPTDRTPLPSSTTTSSSLAFPFLQTENHAHPRPQKFPAAGAAPYVPVRHLRASCHGIAPPVTVRTAVPCYSAPPVPPPPRHHQRLPSMSSPVRMASPVRIRPMVPVFAAAPSSRLPPPGFQVQVKENPSIPTPPQIQVQVKEDSSPVALTPPVNEIQVKQKLEEMLPPASPELGPAVSVEDIVDSVVNENRIPAATESLKQLQL